MSVAEITAAMGLAAQFSHDVGTPRRTPKGAPLPGQYRDTRWRHSTQYEITDQRFTDKIASLVQALIPHKTFFHHVRASGGTAELIIQFFGDGYLADTVPLETLAKITELQLDLGIECFSEPQT